MTVGLDFLASKFEFRIPLMLSLIKLSSMHEFIKLFNASVAAKIASSCSDAIISAKHKDHVNSKINRIGKVSSISQQF